jgi:DNA-binding CsgD family transcriptional regulator/response regulator RpfG family c-di-GMP phosphodiesterase
MSGTSPAPSTAASPSPALQLLGALAFAGDITMGQPVDHSPRTAWLAYRMGLDAGWPADLAQAALTVALLRWAGCTSNAQEFSHLFGDDIEGRANLVQGQSPFVRGAVAQADMHVAIEPLARAHCEVAVQIALRLGVPAPITEALADVLERWDGSGYPSGKRKEEIHPAAQLVALAGAVEIFVRLHGANEGLTRVRRQAAQLFDPSLLHLLNARVSQLLVSLETLDPWRACVDALQPQAFAAASMPLDNVAALLSDYAELKVPRCVGASVLAAQVLGAAATVLGLKDRATLSRAARLHGLGRVSVANAALDRNGTASLADAESIRLSPYWAARILSRCPLLQREAQWVMRAQERSDGSGYPFGLPTPPQQLDLLLLQTVVAYVERIKPWRLTEPLSRTDALRELDAFAAQGKLDERCVRALHGDDPPAREEAHVAGLFDLTVREREVLRQLCLGLSNKQIAKALDISPKTVGTHVERLYAKMAVTTRAAATMKALQWGLVV